ncbi:MAG: hypothetical protein ABMA15_20065 [Vicinamibacterales bacterium]
MMRSIVLAAFVCLFPQFAHADGRLNVRIDFTEANVRGAYNNVGIGWPGFEVELEKGFKTHKVVASGFSFGVRREAFYGFTAFGETKGVQRWDEGTYLTLRVYRSFNIPGQRTWSISPSFAILYGIPGTTLDSTVVTTREDGGLDSTHVFPMRNAGVWKPLAEPADIGANSAMLYPEVSLSIKKRLVKGGINLEWLAGARRIRFGVVDASDQGVRFDDRQTLTPSFGMRLGFRIF